ncbi:MAG TPA: M28 family peptidase [Steroidobacteraceae bacterium]|jgi:Zn-dependent M28 family amino/carboxypeptidase|nr:M28 family peptidase [Steroidobacteraceae bacterium]
MQVRRLLPVLSCAALVLTGCSMRPKEPPPSTDIDDTAFGEYVRVLASDDFQGRKPGTAGEDKTVAYLVENFRRIGLRPGNGKSYLQSVPLLQITAAADAKLAITGADAGRNLIYGKDMVIWTKRAVPEVQLVRSELVFVGYGIVAPEYSWNDYANLDVHGKTVIILADDPGYASRDPTLFNGNAMTAYGRLAYKVEEAARQGAQGALLIHDAAALGFGWSAIQSTWTGAQFEQPAADGHAGRTAIEGWLQNDSARALFSAAGIDFTKAVAAAAHPGFKGLPLGLSVSATIHNTLRTFNSQNVIAVWPGRSAHEFVMYTAHWDSLGIDAARQGRNIYNGAVDDATGVAGLLSLAQSFKHTDPKPERSIAFLATTASEPDLLGSEYYLENPVLPLRQTAAVINVDMLINGGRSRDVSILGFGNTDLEETARAEALLQGRAAHPDPNPQLGLYFRSDSYSFAHRGVPVLYTQAGIDSAARGPVWGKAQIDDYFAHRYRQPGDQYSADWDVGGAVTDLNLDYHVGLHIANSKRFPRWYPNSEFRAPHRANSAARD